MRTSWAFTHLKRSRLARMSAAVLACLAFISIFADLLASNLPIFCRVGGETYLFPNVTHPKALARETCESIGVRVANQGGFAVYPLVRYGPNETNATKSLEAPKLRSGHPFGTDSAGRDVFARLIHGTRTSLLFALVTVLCLTLLGGVLGALGGFYGGLFDAFLSRLIESVSAFPTVVLVLVVQAIRSSPSMLSMTLTIALTRWTEVAQLVPAHVLHASSEEYALAARALGASPLRVLRKHILPNVAVPAIVAAIFSVASVFLIEAQLDFLRVGVPPSTPSWGGIVSEARENTQAWWLLVFPGAILFISVAALHLVGDALRDALDPRLRNAEHAYSRKPETRS